MTYVHKKMRMFKKIDDVQFCWKRSDGRMKNYQSALDARAWCANLGDRRQYILDLVKRGDGKVCVDLKKFENQIRAKKEEQILKGVVANSTDVSQEALPFPRSLQSKTQKHNTSPKKQLTERNNPADLQNLRNEVEDLSQILQKQEAIQRSQYALAVEAVEMLEDIQDIVRNLPNEPKITSNSNYFPKIGQETDGKLPKLKEQTQKKNVLRTTLEHKNEESLRRRLNNLQDLPDEVKALKNKANALLQASGDTKEKDRLFKKNAELMEEIENLKEQLELLRIERNCCQSRLNDLKKIKYEYEDLKEKTRRFDTLQAECACYKSKCENLCNIEAECQKFKKIAEKSEILETEKENLLKKLEDCMCIIHGHKDKIEDLLETTRSLDRLKAECECYKSKCENLYNIETECEKLRKRAQKSEILEAERQDLLHKLQDCLTIINNHENKIKTLSDHIEALTQSLELKSQPKLLRRTSSYCSYRSNVSTILEKSDPINSIKRVMSIEEKLLTKQQETKAKIDLLQTTVEKFKKKFHTEKQKNEDLVNRYTNQTKTLQNIQIEINLVKRDQYLEENRRKLNSRPINAATTNGNQPKNQSLCKCSSLKNSTTAKDIRNNSHLETELILMKNEYKYKHTCLMKQTPCQKEDSFKIEE